MIVKKILIFSKLARQNFFIFCLQKVVSANIKMSKLQEGSPFGFSVIDGYIFTSNIRDFRLKMTKKPIFSSSVNSHFKSTILPHIDKYLKRTEIRFLYSYVIRLDISNTPPQSISRCSLKRAALRYVAEIGRDVCGVALYVNKKVFERVSSLCLPQPTLFFGIEFV